MKIGGTYLLQGPFGRNKTNLPTYLGGASQWQQTPYPARSRNPETRALSTRAHTSQAQISQMLKNLFSMTIDVLGCNKKPSRELTYRTQNLGRPTPPR